MVSVTDLLESLACMFAASFTNMLEWGSWYGHWYARIAHQFVVSGINLVVL